MRSRMTTFTIDNEEDEKDAISKLIEDDPNVYRIYKYANDFGDKSTPTNYKILRSPFQEKAFLSSPYIHSPQMIYQNDSAKDASKKEADDYRTENLSSILPNASPDTISRVSDLLKKQKPNYGKKRKWWQFWKSEDVPALQIKIDENQFLMLEFTAPEDFSGENEQIEELVLKIFKSFEDCHPGKRRSSREPEVIVSNIEGETRIYLAFIVKHIDSNDLASMKNTFKKIIQNLGLELRWG